MHVSFGCIYLYKIWWAVFHFKQIHFSLLGIPQILNTHIYSFMYTLLLTNMQLYVVLTSVQACLPLRHRVALDKAVTSVQLLQDLFQSWADLFVLNVMIKYSSFIQDLLCLCLCLCMCVSVSVSVSVLHKFSPQSSHTGRGHCICCPSGRSGLLELC